MRLQAASKLDSWELALEAIGAKPPRGGNIGPSPSAVRGYAQELGRKAADSLLRGYTAGLEGAADGPIDVVDLFCGCGGLSVGFEYVGRLAQSFRLAAAADYDNYCVETYAANLPLRPRQLDLAKVARSTLSIQGFVDSLPLRPGHPLVVIGGPPCQGFS